MITRLVRRLGAAHPNHRRIAAGAGLIGVLTVVAKLFVAGREITIAWRYGVSTTADAYQLALTATTWVPTMLTGVAAVVLVPRLIKLDYHGEERGHFVAELNASVLILGAAVTLLTWLAAPVAAELLASRTTPTTLQLTGKMIAQMAPVALLVIVSGYLFARLQARERYGYTLSDALPALIIALFVIAQKAGAGASALIVGTVMGYLLQVVILVAVVRRCDPPLGSARVRHRSSEWATLYGSVLLMAIGQSLITASIPIDQGFAARLGQGAVASMGYANRIIMLFSGMATIVLGRALLPVFSRAVAHNELVLGRRHALQWSALLLAVGTAATATLWFAAPVLVRLLFQRGAFTAADSGEVAQILRYGTFQLPLYFGGIALVQWYAATGAFRYLLFITACALAVKLALNALLSPLLGIAGIMLSTAAMYGVTYIVMFMMIRNTRVPALSIGDTSR